MAVRDFINRGMIEGEVEYLEPGQCIFRQGEDVTYLYLVTQGSVAVSHNTTGIDDQIVTPPDFLLGITDLLHDTYSFTAFTLEPTQLIKIKKETVRKALHETPVLRLYLLKMMSWEASLTKMAFE
ncbi:cyclic nucleotide-binding domain-containing protein [Pontibacter sp. HSC-14F20]|uniref:cyclic nucleotide-binding domain-containing protein n=1 Tax=Pontibacter sp. HSC-14F20 TaxID=2864136 RepID=UPI001C736375|nr:cyclic nucleotide-binding domain-containing protein [Pontibacter sp. HSC-14F20]MBX0335030.1 cyclic nucleotide-binding domain-containing protein [Pontibacter sp. HSC-14F20]